jgi:hypothetical protein
MAAGFTRLTGKPARDKVSGALVEVQPIHGIARDSKAESNARAGVCLNVGHSR